jgi:hypothetical protein
MSSLAVDSSSAACGAFPFGLAVARVRIARTVPCDTSAAAAISRCESPSRPAASDRLLVLAIGFAFSLRRARDVPKHVAAQLSPGAQLARAFGVGDRGQGRAGGDRGTRRLGNVSLRRLLGG